MHEFEKVYAAIKPKVPKGELKLKTPPKKTTNFEQIYQEIIKNKQKNSPVFRDCNLTLQKVLREFKPANNAEELLFQALTTPVKPIGLTESENELISSSASYLKTQQI